jgi:hypothetical protein
MLVLLLATLLLMASQLLRVSLLPACLLLLASLVLLALVFYVLYCTMRHPPDHQTKAIGVSTTVGTLISGFWYHRISQLIAGGCRPSFNSLHPSHLSEPVFLNVYGAQELIPRNEFRQPMWPGGPVRFVRKPYSYSVPSPHRLFKNSSSDTVPCTS